MPMTPRERVLTTLNHEEPDRVPLVIGVSNATGIKMKPYQEMHADFSSSVPRIFSKDHPTTVKWFVWAQHHFPSDLHVSGDF